MKKLLLKIKYWIIFSVLGVGVVIAAEQVNPPIPSIALEKMQIAYNNAPQIKAKYKMEQASFIQEAIDENAIQIEIGDKTKDKFSEELNIRKWDNEVSLKIKHKNNEKKSLELDGNKIKMKENKTETHFYEVENGYEYEIILLEKPDTNTVEFDIEIKGLNFYYQPALIIKDNPEADYCTDTTCFKEIDGQMATTTHRPENVVGSYAVYHESKTGHIIYPIDKSEYTQEELNEMVVSKKYIGKENNKTGKIEYFKSGTNYMAGKAFHIYRPKIIDSVGTEVWGILNIDNRILTVEIPQEFLDNAIYPVIVDPTFGCDPESPGGSWQNILDRVSGSQFTGVAGTGDSISGYLHGGITGEPRKFALYKHSNNDLIDNGLTEESTAMLDPADWETLAFVSTPTIEAVDYVIAASRDSGFLGLDMSYDDGVGDIQGHYETHTYPNFPDPASFTHEDRKYSIYATYTPSGGEEEAPAPTADAWWDE